MDPAEAVSYVTTPTGAPLTLDDVQAKLARAQGGLNNFRTLDYNPIAAAGVRDALIAEIVKSIKEGLRGNPLSTLHPRLLRRGTTRVPDQAAAAEPEPEPEPQPGPGPARILRQSSSQARLETVLPEEP